MAKKLLSLCFKGIMAHNFKSEIESMTKGAEIEACPCAKCVDDRHMGCHSKCSRYLDWRKRYQIEREKMVKAINRSKIWL